MILIRRCNKLLLSPRSAGHNDSLFRCPRGKQSSLDSLMKRTSLRYTERSALSAMRGVKLVQTFVTWDAQNHTKDIYHSVLSIEGQHLDFEC